MTCEITIKTNSEPIRRLINDDIIKLKDIDIYSFNKNNSVKIFMNGDLMGFSNNPAKIVKDWLDFFCSRSTRYRRNNHV